MTTSPTDDSWEAYYQKTQHAPPRATLLQALQLFDAKQFKGQAIDLACGNGRDTFALLHKGWQVLAIDKEAEAETFITTRLPPNQLHRFRFACTPFHQIAWQATDLVNASYALPFCEAEHFLSLWQQIVNAIRPKGRFAGQFLGPRDDWNGKQDIICHSRKEIESLFQSFEIESFQVEEVDENGLDGQLKHWHIFHLVACKR